LDVVKDIKVKSQQNYLGWAYLSNLSDFNLQYSKLLQFMSVQGPIACCFIIIKYGSCDGKILQVFCLPLCFPLKATEDQRAQISDSEE
jgi:hypothetical protein